MTETDAPVEGVQRGLVPRDGRLGIVDSGVQAVDLGLSDRSGIDALARDIAERVTGMPAYLVAAAILRGEQVVVLQAGERVIRPSLSEAPSDSSSTPSRGLSNA